MLTILEEVWRHIVSLKPSFISRHPHFNFITIHYFWIIGLTIFGSICLYPRSDLTYINALFLAAGAATQSGLNPVNINGLNTWQQFALFGITTIGNPITINTFVVFVRLFWFEKRFQHIAREAKRSRWSIAKTLSKSKTGERDAGREEMGIQGRSIVVMHDTTRPNGMTNDGEVSQDLQDHLKDAINAHKDSSSLHEAGEAGSGRVSDPAEEPDRPNLPSHQTQIRFADQVKPTHSRTSDEHLRIPIRRNTEAHIAFVERQRNPEDRAVLRIPGPRDADAGVDPQMVDESDAVHQTVSHRMSTLDSRRGSNDHGALNGDDHRRRNITIEEPSRVASPEEQIIEDARAFKHTLSVLRFRKPRIMSNRDKVHHADNGLHASWSRRSTINSIRRALSHEKEEEIPYLSWQPTIGRNSAFVDLTEAQREELGGIEYRSLKSLALILIFYFWGFTIFAYISLIPWILKSKTWGPVVEQDGQGRVWWAIFTSTSAFTDLGFTLTPDSMISFQRAIWPLLLMSFLIIIGNTGFPIMLRIIIWVTSLYVPKNSGMWEELRFLLDHPRRCFTLLFPAHATWWLFWILVILNGLDLIFFIILDLGNTIVTQLPVRIRILDGWFQAVSTRTAGFGVVNLAQLHPAIQVSYLIMMYISVLPIAISVRRTNVYEERSLGIYETPSEEREDDGEPSYVGAHLRRQLSFDLWYIFLGFFIISIAEGHRLQSGDPAFTMFSVLFEIVSAYGTVGLSLGYPTNDCSFSAEFGVIAKLVIIAMQIRGRHRGLPYELDRAILLPSEHLHHKENDQPTVQRARRRSSSVSTNGRAPLSTGARTRTRSKSSQRPTQNILSTLLHPGPIIPTTHRHSPRSDKNHERRSSREERGRETSPKSIHYGSPFGGHSTREDDDRVESRKNSYQEDEDPEVAVQDPAPEAERYH